MGFLREVAMDNSGAGEQPSFMYAAHIKHPDDIRKLNTNETQAAVRITNWWTSSMYSWVSTRSFMKELSLANAFSLATRLTNVFISSDVEDIIRICHTEIRALLLRQPNQLKTLRLQNIQCIPDELCGCEKHGIKGKPKADFDSSLSYDDFTKPNDTKVLVTRDEASEVAIQVRGTTSFLVPGENIIQRENVMHAFPFSCNIGLNLRKVEFTDFSTRIEHINYLLCNIRTLKTIKFFNVVALPERAFTGKPEVTSPMRELTSTIEALHIEFDKNALNEYAAYPSSLSLAMLGSIKNFPNLSKQTLVGLLDDAETIRHFTGTTTLSEAAVITLARTNVNADLLYELLNKYGNETLLELRNVKLKNAAEPFRKLNEGKSFGVDWDIQDKTFVTAFIEIDVSGESTDENDYLMMRTKVIDHTSSSFCVIPNERVYSTEIWTPYREWSLYSFANNNIAIQHADGIELIQRLDMKSRQSFVATRSAFFQPVLFQTISRRHRFRNMVEKYLKGNNIEVLSTYDETQKNSTMPLTITLVEDYKDLQDAVALYSNRHPDFCVVLLTQETNRKPLNEELDTSFHSKVVFMTPESFIEDMDRLLAEITLERIAPVAEELFCEVRQAKSIDRNEIIIEMKEILLAISSIYDDIGVEKPDMYSKLNSVPLAEMEQFARETAKALFNIGAQIGTGTGLNAVYFYIDANLPEHEQADIRLTIIDNANKIRKDINYVIDTISSSPKPLVCVGSEIGDGDINGTLTAFVRNEDVGDDRLYAILSGHVADKLNKDANDSIPLKFNDTNIGTIKTPLPHISIDVALAEILEDYSGSCQPGIRDDTGKVTQCEICVFDGVNERKFLRKEVFINGAFTSPGFGVLRQIDHRFGTNLCFLLITDSKTLPPGIDEGRPFCIKGDSGALVLAFQTRNGSKTLYVLGIVVGRDHTAAAGVGRYLAIRFPDGLAHLSNHYSANYQLCQT